MLRVIVIVAFLQCADHLLALLLDLSCLSSFNTKLITVEHGENSFT